MSGNMQYERGADGVISVHTDPDSYRSLISACLRPRATPVSWFQAPEPYLLNTDFVETEISWN
ncbi:hypothetical protein J6590_008132 [Homalodisca vitripennis]|nr:hypothetical protein J6590_008132 [Homalodisca vitripennis]